jgi:REP element-mobilizing transposase RayT
MARKLRIEYEGAVYHVMNRGDRSEAIFKDNRDRELFMEALGQVCEKTGWQVHSWCLMPNHFHLVVETPRANLVSGMRWFLAAYTSRFNRRHKLFGHLFSGRYKSLIVDGSGNGYLKSVCDYVHLNPVRARMIPQGKPLSTYPWSSWPAYLAKPSRRPGWLRVDRLLGEWGIKGESAQGRRRLEAIIEQRRTLELAAQKEDWKTLRRGWCYGSKDFKEAMLNLIGAQQADQHSGEERRESDEQKAERLVTNTLRKWGWRKGELEKRRKGDAQKAKLALRLRQETTMTWVWIARRLVMGHWRTALNATLANKRPARKTKKDNAKA